MINITFLNGKPVITDDAGERLRGIRKLAVHYDYQGATEVTITLVVDGHHVTLGDQDRDASQNSES
jgi:hypothetical protein